MNAPAVTFSYRTINPNWGTTHEVIVMTPELQQFAIAAAPIVEAQLARARNIGRLVLASSTGEASWAANNGHSVARREDHLAQVATMLGLLAKGLTASSFNGWVDRREWGYILDAVATDAQ